MSSIYLYLAVKGFDEKGNKIPLVGVITYSGILSYIGIESTTLKKMLNAGQSIDTLIIPSSAVCMDTKKNFYLMDINVLSEDLFNILTEIECDYVLSRITCPIKKLIIEKNIKSIQQNVFRKSTVVNVIWPEDHTVIPRGSFDMSSQLESISGIENVNFIGANTFRKTNLHSFIWPNQCSVIPESCFYDCQNLTEFDICNSNIRVDKWAFANTKLEVLDFSKTLYFSADNNAFPPSCKIKKSFYDIN